VVEAQLGPREDVRGSGRRRELEEERAHCEGGNGGPTEMRTHARRKGVAFYRRAGEAGATEAPPRRCSCGRKDPGATEPCWLSAGRPRRGGARAHRILVSGDIPPRAIQSGTGARDDAILILAGLWVGGGLIVEGGGGAPVAVWRRNAMCSAQDREPGRRGAGSFRSTPL
jgi:hypothetical protein